MTAVKLDLTLRLHRAVERRVKAEKASARLDAFDKVLDTELENATSNYWRVIKQVETDYACMARQRNEAEAALKAALAQLSAQRTA